MNLLTVADWPVVDYAKPFLFCKNSGDMKIRPLAPGWLGAYSVLVKHGITKNPSLQRIESCRSGNS